MEEKTKIDNTERAIRAARIASTAATGGIGGVVRQEVQRRTNVAVRGLAEKAAKKIKEGVGEEKPKKLAGMGFWLVFTGAVVSELICAALDLSLILAIVSTFVGIATTFLIYFYLAIQGISFTSRQVASMIISAIITLIPFLNILPAQPVNLLILKVIENNEFLKGKAQLLVKS